MCWAQLTGGCKIRILSITAANSYPLIDLGSTKREDSDLGRGDDPSQCGWLKVTDRLASE